MLKLFVFRRRLSVKKYLYYMTPFILIPLVMLLCDCLDNINFIHMSPYSCIIALALCSVIGGDELEFASHGDGTCSVIKIKSEIPRDKGNLIVNIPTHSPTGDLVTRIEEDAFGSVCNIIEVTISDSVSEIGPHAFMECTELSKIVFSSGLTSIDDHAFYKCYSLKNVVLPEGLTEMGEAAFGICGKLESVTLPNSLIDIGSASFRKCYNLKNFIIDNNPVYRVNGNCLIETTTKTLVFAWQNFSIPADGSVIKIGAYAFSACPNLTELVLPPSITALDAWALADCTALRKLTLSENITEIGSGAFSSCENLTSISIPDGVERLPGSLFRFCEKLKTVYIPKSINKIDSTAFSDCNLLEVHYDGTCSEWQSLSVNVGNLYLVFVNCNDGGYQKY